MLPRGAVIAWPPEWPIPVVLAKPPLRGGKSRVAATDVTELFFPSDRDLQFSGNRKTVPISCAGDARPTTGTHAMSKEQNASFTADTSWDDQQLLQQVVLFYHDRLKEHAPAKGSCSSVA